jgi:hypothetical protein
MTDPTGRSRAADEPPPLLGSWRNVYLVVAAELALIVALLAALTWWAA